MIRVSYLQTNTFGAIHVVGEIQRVGLRRDFDETLWLFVT
jgi:hypothetical protein